MRKPVIYFNGQWIEANATLLEVLTPGILRARGIFETIAVNHSQICFFDRHLKRFKQGAHLYKLNIPLSDRRLLKELQTVTDFNEISDGRLRLSLFEDHGSVFMVIVGQSMQTRRQSRRAFRAIVSSFTRLKTRLSHVKSIHYQPFRAAFVEAHNQGYDEGLLLNSKRKIVEGATTNIFFVKKNNLFTPSVRCGCLNGIIRGVVLSLARQLKLSVHVGEYGMRHLLTADEAFVTNSLLGIKPLKSVDDNSFDYGPGTITKRLIDAYKVFPKI